MFKFLVNGYTLKEIISPTDKCNRQKKLKGEIFNPSLYGTFTTL